MSVSLIGLFWESWQEKLILVNVVGSLSLDWPILQLIVFHLVRNGIVLALDVLLLVVIFLIPFPDDSHFSISFLRKFFLFLKCCRS